MKCYICDVEEGWKSMGAINPERELLVCKTCGNIAYRVDAAKDEAMRDYYRKDYRKAPTFMNIITTTNKLNYVKLFLREFLGTKREAPMIVGDVGCATGYLPNFFRQIGHRATGSEYTVTFRRFAEHYYGIPITEELTPKHKYNLITMYHVLEHIVQPDEKLAHYVSLLADGGHMMIATPEWLDTLEEASGAGIEAGFSHLFHKDHINVFTRQSLQNLFSKVGLEIVKEDHIQYGQTYLLKKADPAKTADKITYEVPDKQVEKILKTHEAIRMYNSRDYEAALKVWPKFPEAYLALALRVHGKAPDHQAEIFNTAVGACPGNTRILAALGLWFYQNGRHEDALKVFTDLQNVKPNADVFVYMGYCYSALGKRRDAMASFAVAMEMNPLKWQECMNWTCSEAVATPAWDERAEVEIKEQMFTAARKAGKVTISPKDPGMNQPIAQESLKTAPGEAEVKAQDKEPQVA